MRFLTSIALVGLLAGAASTVAGERSCWVAAGTAALRLHRPLSKALSCRSPPAARSLTEAAPEAAPGPEAWPPGIAPSAGTRRRSRAVSRRCRQPALTCRRCACNTFAGTCAHAPPTAPSVLPCSSGGGPTGLGISLCPGPHRVFGAICRGEPLMETACTPCSAPPRPASARGLRGCSRPRVCCVCHAASVMHSCPEPSGLAPG